MASDRRTDKCWGSLEARMNVADKMWKGLISWKGDVREPQGAIAAIGAGGNYALSAARALVDYEKDPESLAQKAMQIAAEICVYNNDQTTLEIIDIQA